MAENHRVSAVRPVLVLVAGVLVALSLAGCGAASSSSTSSTESASTSPAAAVSPAKRAAYEKLLSLDDVMRLTKISDATTMPPGSRAEDSLYYALYTSPAKPQFLAFRIGTTGAFDEQRTLLVDKETTLTVGGHEAISWSSGEFDRGIAVRVPGETYFFVSHWLFTTPEGAPSLTMDQLKQVADLVVQRTK